MEGRCLVEERVLATCGLCCLYRSGDLYRLGGTYPSAEDDDDDDEERLSGGLLC